MTLSDRSRLLFPSPTLGMTARARSLKAEGKDVISFSVGEPDFDTPEIVRNAAIDALNAGQTRYTASVGTPELRKAVAGRLSADHGMEFEPNRVIVSCGAKQSVYNSLMVTVNPGDEVILIAPYWMTYRDQVLLAGGVPNVIATTAESGFVPSVDQLRAAINPRTKAIILNTPSNPTGATLPIETLRAVAELAQEHSLWIICDEIYEYLTYGQPHVSITQVGGDLLDRAILVSGCSKSYAMTGWRIGYCYAPPAVAQAMSNLQDQVTSNPTSFAQAGAVQAMTMPRETIEAMRAEFQVRRDLALDCLTKIPGVTAHRPQGAFYIFANVEEHLGSSVSTDVELADYLLDQALVATVPGSVFEGPGHIRLSYATSREDIQRGIERIGTALAQLRH